MADKNMANFLATDKVPDTIFGIPIVSRREDYTEADIAFFQEHPEAGGYYDMGDGEGEEPPEGLEPPPQGPRGAVKAGKARGAYPGAWNNPGNVRPGSNAYEGQTGTVIGKKSGTEFLTFDTPQHGLNSMSNVIGQIVRVKIPERFAKGELPNNKFTVRNLVSVYAPSNENKTDEYIDFVSKRMGVRPDAVLDVNDGGTMAKLLDSMIRKDSGHEHADWFTPEEYRSAVELMKGAK